MNILCWLRHRREYVAMKKVAYKKRCHSLSCCSKMVHEQEATGVRWVCSRCGQLGERILVHGTWKIEFGRLVSDKKAWASWDTKE